LRILQPWARETPKHSEFGILQKIGVSRRRTYDGYGITISAPPDMFVTLSNAEKQAHYRERRLGVDGEKVRVGLNLKVALRAKMAALHAHRGYTITDLVDELADARRTAGNIKAHRQGVERLPRRRIERAKNGRRPRGAF
jgi:predicted DNA-binding ribbon-helix-helix protein